MYNTGSAQSRRDSAESLDSLDSPDLPDHAAAAAQELAAAKRERATLQKALDAARRDAADGDGRSARLARVEGELEALRQQFNATVTQRGRLEERYAELEREAELYAFERSALADMDTAFQRYKQDGKLNAALDGLGGERPPGHSMEVVEHRSSEATIEERTLRCILEREEAQLILSSSRVSTVREERDACVHDCGHLEQHARGVDMAADNAADQLRLLREENAINRREFKLRLADRRLEIKRQQRRKVEEEKERLKREEMLAGSRRNAVLKARENKVKSAVVSLSNVTVSAEQERMVAQFRELVRLACPHAPKDTVPADAIVEHFKSLDNQEGIAQQRRDQCEVRLENAEKELKKLMEVRDGGNVAAFKSGEDRRAIDRWDTKVTVAVARRDASRARYMEVVQRMETLRRGLAQLNTDVTHVLAPASHGHKGGGSGASGVGQGLSVGGGVVGAAGGQLPADEHSHSGGGEGFAHGHGHDDGAEGHGGDDADGGDKGPSAGGHGHDKLSRHAHTHGSAAGAGRSHKRVRGGTHDGGGEKGGGGKSRGGGGGGEKGGAGGEDPSESGEDAVVLPSLFGLTAKLLADAVVITERLVDKLADAAGDEAAAVREALAGGVPPGEIMPLLGVTDAAALEPATLLQLSPRAHRNVFDDATKRPGTAASEYDVDAHLEEVSAKARGDTSAKARTRPHDARANEGGAGVIDRTYIKARASKAGRRLSGSKPCALRRKLADEGSRPASSTGGIQRGEGGKQRRATMAVQTKTMSKRGDAPPSVRGVPRRGTAGARAGVPRRSQ